MNTMLFRRAGLLMAALLAAFTAGADDKIAIRGSNTVGEELAPRLITGFKAVHPNTSFDLEFKGSGYGIGALMGGFCDIAAASKPVSKEQLEIAKIRDVTFKEYVLGSYSVSVLVNAENPVANLTTNQVRDLFTGKIQNWKDVGGPDAPVHLFIRDPVSGTHLGFKELAMNFEDYGEHVQLFTNYLDLADAVAKDPHGIGYAGLDLTAHAGTKAVTIGGVAATAENVNGGKYPYARTLRLYTDTGKETAAAREFINFSLSADGQKIVTQFGDAPKP